MLNKKLLFLIGLIFISVFILIIMQSVLALTADSSNYSVARFGTGIQASNLSSDNFEARVLSITGAATRAAENNEYTTNIGFWGNTTYYISVSISSHSISPKSAVVGSTIGLYILALNSQNVWAKIISPNNQEQTLTLINGGTVTYLPSPSVVGRYNVTFYSNSSTGAIASVVDYFELTEQTTPVTSPPSGDGGRGSSTTTILEKTCNYNWDCTPWSICSDGKQKRKCKNIGTCNGTESKPIEEMQCSEALFDVTLKFKEIGLTQNETLKFNIDLIETKGVEKIDVHAKYSIIDINNNEIFSQIETLAIQGNLTYEKEINEVRLKDGQYILRIDILYGNLQRASAEQSFRIKNGEIEIAESLSRTQETNIFILVGIVIILLIIILLIIYIWFKRFLTKFNRLEKNSLEQELEKGVKFVGAGKTNEARLAYDNIKKIYDSDKKAYREMYPRIMEFYNKILKSRPLIGFIGFIGIIVLIFSLLKLNITGSAIGSIKSYNWGVILIPIIASIIILLIILRKRFTLIYKKIIEFLSEIINKNKKYASNSIKGLINKKVYSESGNYIGKVKDVILGENKIESLKIKVDRKHNFKTKGMIIDYKQVKSAGEVIIIIDKSFEYLENHKNKKEFKKRGKMSNE